MAKVILKEASNLTPQEKMRLCNIGQRRQNWGACSLAKLIDNYKICLQMGYTKAGDEAATELKQRGLWELVAPRTWYIDFLPTNVMKAHAQWLWNIRNQPQHLYAEVAAHRTNYPKDGLLPSEFLIRAWILCAAMNKPELASLMQDIKSSMQSNGTYAKYVPQYVQDILSRPSRNDRIAEAVSGVIYA